MESQLTIYIGADHRGFNVKQRLVEYLRDLFPDIAIADLGAETYDPDDDFNDSAIAVGTKVSEDPAHSYGILVCGSSFGVCMQANRFPEVRAINPLTPHMAKIGRQHNAANVLCLSSDQLHFDKMCELIQIFLATAPLPDERFRRRNQRLDEIYS